MSVILKAGLQHLRRQAISTNIEAARYKDILERALQTSTSIQQACGFEQASAGRHRGPRIAFLAAPGRQYAEATLATWLSGGIAVPLCQSHPEGEIKYVLENSQTSVVMSSPDFADQIEGIASNLGIDHLRLGEQGVNMDEEKVAEKITAASSSANEDDGSLIIYTSGTTGKPKVGAAVEFLPKFSPSDVWKHLMREEDSISVFMGVPTMYNYLLSKYKEMSEEDKEKARRAASRLRLTVSGSAACPVPIMKQWEELSGQRLLERYGMTETGMLLSNKYRGERNPGFVGYPLPGVSAKLKDGGELAVKGDVLFKEYWNKPEATQDSFDEEGYFRTGDTASVEGEDQCWKILGRTSTDIIKSGGYKISALQIEDALLENSKISNCAVFGVEDEALGEAIVAVISSDGKDIDEEEVKKFASKQLPKYQVPHSIIVMDEIPRNPMGKINKKALKKQLNF